MLQEWGKKDVPAIAKKYNGKTYDYWLYLTTFDRSEQLGIEVATYKAKEYLGKKRYIDDAKVKDKVFSIVYTFLNNLNIDGSYAFYSAPDVEASKIVASLEDVIEEFKNKPLSIKKEIKPTIKDVTRIEKIISDYNALNSNNIGGKTYINNKVYKETGKFSIAYSEGNKVYGLILTLNNTTKVIEVVHRDGKDEDVKKTSCSSLKNMAEELLKLKEVPEPIQAFIKIAVKYLTKRV